LANFLKKIDRQLIGVNDEMAEELLTPETPATPQKASRGKKKEDAPEAPKEPVFVAGTSLALVQEELGGSIFVPNMLHSGMTPTERREAVREVLKKVSTADDRLKLVAGEMLYEVAENGYHKEWINPNTNMPYATFEDYCLVEHNMKKSMAHYLKGIYKKFVVECKLSADHLKDLEWSKAKELTRIVTPENVLEVLDATKSMSVPQVQAYVRSKEGKPPKETKAAGSDEGSGDSSAPAEAGEKEEFSTLKFRVTPAQSENINSAMQVAQEFTGSQEPGTLLDTICTEYLAGNASASAGGVLARLDYIIQSVERAFKVKLEVKEMDPSLLAQIEAQSGTVEVPAAS
jgi:hypothetical protein